MSSENKPITIQPSLSINFFRLSNDGVSENLMASVTYIGTNGQLVNFQSPTPSSADSIADNLKDLLTLLSVQLKTILRTKAGIIPLNIIPLPAPVEVPKLEEPKAETQPELALVEAEAEPAGGC